MGFHMSFCCDFCSVNQPVAFDSPSETYQDLIDALRKAGWMVTPSEKPWIVRVSCPACPPARPATPVPSGAFGP